MALKKEHVCLTLEGINKNYESKAAQIVKAREELKMYVYDIVDNYGINDKEKNLYKDCKSMKLCSTYKLGKLYDIDKLYAVKVSGRKTISAYDKMLNKTIEISSIDSLIDLYGILVDTINTRINEQN